MKKPKISKKKSIILDPRKVNKVNRFIQRNSGAQDLDDYIYIVKCHQFYKIGITFDVDKRINFLQCGNPYPIEIIYLVRCPEVRLVEQSIHQCFIDKKIRGEWFILNDKDIEDIKETIIGVIDKFGPLIKSI